VSAPLPDFDPQGRVIIVLLEQ